MNHCTLVHCTWVSGDGGIVPQLERCWLCAMPPNTKPHPQTAGSNHSVQDAKSKSGTAVCEAWLRDDRQATYRCLFAGFAEKREGPAAYCVGVSVGNKNRRYRESRWIRTLTTAFTESCRANCHESRASTLSETENTPRLNREGRWSSSLRDWWARRLDLANPGGRFCTNAEADQRLPPPDACS